MSMNYIDYEKILSSDQPRYEFKFSNTNLGYCETLFTEVIDKAVS
jgi:hypothetical protein